MTVRRATAKIVGAPGGAVVMSVLTPVTVKIVGTPGIVMIVIRVTVKIVGVSGTVISEVQVTVKNVGTPVVVTCTKTRVNVLFPFVC